MSALKQLEELIENNSHREVAETIDQLRLLVDVLAMRKMNDRVLEEGLKNSDWFRAFVREIGSIAYDRINSQNA